MGKFVKRRMTTRATDVEIEAIQLNLLYPENLGTPIIKITNNCFQCGAHERFIDWCIGERVCSSCAVVQPGPVFDLQQWLHTSSLVRKHIYSRSVYFKELIRSIRGEKRATIKQVDYIRLQNACVHITPLEWKTQRSSILVPIMKKLKLGRYKVSKLWLAFKLSKGVCRPVPILGNHINTIMQDFNKVERAWPNVKEQLAPERKIFMNYAYLYSCLVERLNCPAYRLDVELPKNGKSRHIQSTLWRGLCCANKWRWFPLPA
jgi:hypothetical protein